MICPQDRADFLEFVRFLHAKSTQEELAETPERGVSLRFVVAALDERFCLLEILRLGQSDFKIAGPEMTNL